MVKKEFVGLIESVDNSSNFSSVANSVSIIWEPATRLKSTLSALLTISEAGDMFVGRRLDQHMVLFLKFLRPLLAQRSQLLQLKPFFLFAADSLSFLTALVPRKLFSVAFL